jgi:hypothetical protein
MPTVLHDCFGGELGYEIATQLRAFTDNSTSTAAFVRSIYFTGSATLQFEQEEAKERGEISNNKLMIPFDRHDPDLSFQHNEARYPSVIIEVSYSQKKKDLPYLADDYILGSHGNIKVVVGLDLDYRGTKTATLSIWRPHFGKENDQVVLSAAQTEVEKVRYFNYLNL